MSTSQTRVLDTFFRGQCSSSRHDKERILFTNYARMNTLWDFGPCSCAYLASKWIRLTAIVFLRIFFFDTLDKGERLPYGI